MSFKALLSVCVVLAFTAGCLILMGARPTPAADVPRAATPEVGHYQVLQDKDGEPAYLFDPATGQVWRASHTEMLKWEWLELMAPAKKK